MKGILVLLVLLNTRTTKVYSQPYQANPEGICRDKTTEYLLDESNLCCKKCPPGQRLKELCSETTETVCEPCPTGQFMESRNYSPNCFACNKCKTVKGLQYIQNCSSTTRSQCGCQPGMYCIMEFADPYCSACRKYKLCKAGYGVSVPGMANSDVKCERCPDGTFSDKDSFTDRCQPHTNCHGRVIVRQGNATSDAVCDSDRFVPTTQSEVSTTEPHTTASTVMKTISLTPGPIVLREPKDRQPTDIPVTRTLQPSTGSDITVVIGSVIGVILLIIATIVFSACKMRQKKGAERFHPKVDANGNCETGDKIYSREIQLTQFEVPAPEQCLLEKSEACSNQSQDSSNTETLTRTDACSSYESISPLQSTIALHQPHSARSEPMSLISYIEPATPQTSITTQSQPTSPKTSAPVTTSPHFNVNITFHIGNGSGSMPSVIPTDLMQVDFQLPFGEEEESSSIPQQEAGKQSLMSVQESTS